MNVDIKRHIDSARDVLVGVVPNPTSQIEQITTALIYKFMDDMDQSAIKAGGEPSFFLDDLEKYAWTRLMDSRIGNQDKMNLYVEALSKFSESKQLPELFRDIFKSAFLPYRSPEVLGLFLKEMSFFDYSHPEDLGDAYEYLLSIMSSQGAAGQFRTPRHIIDFIVKVVNPTKNDKILDPACGTAGFLISAYKHILEQHDGKEEIEGKEKPLTPDERRNLMNNLEGYDIDPAMVRIAQVNMYLHQFKNPKIYQYDSLSMEGRWNDKFDVIMANPPFMSPKGGIKPHGRFSIKSSRSEVLFVDYILEHIRGTGRGAVIVPDGIINNKNLSILRKKLLDSGLFAVVSLHRYVFKPYAAAKTSILFFDKKWESKKILFCEMEEDGYQKGEQRNQIKSNDIPLLTKLITNFRNEKKIGLLDKYENRVKIMDFSKIESKYINNYIQDNILSPSVYINDNCARQRVINPHRIVELFDVERGTLQSTKAIPGEYRFITASSNFYTHQTFTHDCEALIIAVSAGGSLGKIKYFKGKFVASDLCLILTPKKGVEIDLSFYEYYFKSIKARLVSTLAKGVSKPSVSQDDFENFFIDYFPKEKQINYGKMIRGKLQEISLHKRKIKEIETGIQEKIEKL